MIIRARAGGHELLFLLIIRARAGGHELLFLLIIRAGAGETLKKVREAKGLSQKELASHIDMAQAQYSRIESGKTDPSFSVVTRISKALGLNLSELFQADEIFSESNSYDKTLMEKLRLLDSLDEVEKKSIYNLIDSLISKKKLKDNLSDLLAS